MNARAAAAVTLVIAAGLGFFALGVVAADLYIVGLLILFLGVIGAAVLAGDLWVRYLGNRRPPR